MVVEDVYATSAMETPIASFTRKPTVPLPAYRQTVTLPETDEIYGYGHLHTSTLEQQLYQERMTRRSFFCVCVGGGAVWMMTWLATDWLVHLLLAYLHLT